jgi:hypothetical protein
MKLEQWIITRADGSQILIDRWYDAGGRTKGVTVAERDSGYGTWGPPMEAVKG